ncbi:MAG: MFS transporter [Desulfuromonadaceae bacterium]|nr:MFS transporter [Desulfuromonadaceae bacterium]
MKPTRQPTTGATTPKLSQARFAWCMYDWANSAFATVVLAAVLPVYFAALVPAGGGTLCLFGHCLTLPATALWSYAVTCSMLLVAVTAPWLGAHADRYCTRRRWLIICCLTGSAATCLLVMAGPGRYLLAAALFVVANACFAAGNIFYNAFLPMLSKGTEMDRLSARGFAFGYLGGGLALLLVFLLISRPAFFGLADGAFASRVGFLLTGLWWALFALPAFRHLREEQGPTAGPFPLGGWRGYLRTFRKIASTPDLLRFLLAFLCYNDGIQTIIVVAAIFAREELAISQTSILGCFLMIQFVAMPGALLFGRLAGRYGSKRALLTSLLLFIVVTVYAYHMEQAWQFWLLGLLVALILGGSQAISRSFYGALIPPGHNAEFYAFYAISGKCASVLGPLSFALLIQLTGSNRSAILGLAVFFILGVALLLTVNEQRGRQAAQLGEP